MGFAKPIEQYLFSNLLIRIHVFMYLKDIIRVEGAVCADHVHLCLSIPPSEKVSDVVGYIKGKSALMIFERHANLKYKYGNRHFWCRGYYVDTVGKNEIAIQRYIKEQLSEDRQAEQLTMDNIDPFTGSHK